MSCEVLTRFPWVLKLLVAASFSAILTPSAVAQQAPINISIGLSRAEFKGTDARIDASISFTNTSPNKVRILKWGTPFDGEAGHVNGDYLNVFRGQERVTYVGPVYKRAGPTAEDYIELGPQGKLSALINLEDGYAVISSGVYSVTFNTEAVQTEQSLSRPLGAVEKAVAPKLASSSVATFVLSEGRHFRGELKIATPPSRFESCNSDQQAALVDTLPKAQQIAGAARLALGETAEAERAHALRYSGWFGDYSKDRYATIATHFAAIHDALNNTEVSFNCGGNRCSRGTFAYVFPTKPYVIYPCEAFWRADLTGTDSKAGTLVHEISHFNIVAGTADVVYGQQSARALAGSAPDEAIQNADSHEYFAENSPELAMKIATGEGDKAAAHATPK